MEVQDNNQTTEAVESQQPQGLTPDQRLQAIDERERAIKEYENRVRNEIETYNSQMSEKMEKINSFEERIKKDPFGVLGEYGHSYDSLTELALGDSVEKTPDARIKELEKTISELKSERENEKAQLEQKDRAQKIENSIKQYKNQFLDEAKQAGDKYSLYTMNSDEASDLAYDVAEAYHKEHGKLPEKGVILDYVENYLQDYYQGVIDKLKENSKFKDQFIMNPQNNDDPAIVNNDLLPPFAQENVDTHQQNSGQPSENSVIPKFNAGGSFERMREQKLWEIKRKLQ